MKLTLKLTTTAKYISFWNSIFNLTKKEISILLDFISISSTYGLCTLEAKKAVSTQRNIKDYNTLNNYVKKLKDKNAIELTNDGYKLHRLLRNEENVTVTVVRGR
jgi:hypothetical protein